jgi:6-phosphogluconolactonase (cycloisomerase 2 family)
VEKHKISAAAPKLEANQPVTSISRRVFLAEVAAAAIAAPAVLRASFREPNAPALLHVATSSSHTGHIHTFALTSRGCKLLGSTAVDAFAAFATHPVLPILYVARDCEHWNGLPCGVVESYAVRREARPLQLLAQTPMALSATGPRSVAVSSCGRHLLVSASTGGAWNSFTLNDDGMPASVALARKETGLAVNSRDVLLPAPYGLAFSPRTLLAVGADPGIDRLSFLQPSSAGIAVVARCDTPPGLAGTQPAWTADGRHIVVATARKPSLLLYRVAATELPGSQTGMDLAAVIPTATAVTALLAHPVKAAVFTSRTQGSTGVLEAWEIQDNHLHLTSAMLTPTRILALAHHRNAIWVASNDRLAQISMPDLRKPSFEIRIPDGKVQAIISQNLAI